MGKLKRHAIEEGQPGSDKNTALTAPMSELVCLECRKGRVKCTGVFPCARCVKMGLSCLPQHRKRGRPPKARSSVYEILKTFRDYAVHLPPSGKAHVASMIASFFYKEKAHNPHFAGLKNVESLDLDVEIASTLRSLAHPTVSFPTPAEADAQLLLFESWVPPTILRLRDCFTTAATVCVFIHYGYHKYKANARFAELFESEEQMTAADQDVSRYNLEDLWEGFDTLSTEKTDMPRALPHSLMNRVVSLSDYLDFTRAGIQGAVSKKAPNDIVVMEGIYEMQPSVGEPLMCHVDRHCWMSPGGQQGAYYMAIQPLPSSKYITQVAYRKPGAAAGTKKRARTTAMVKEEPMAVHGAPISTARDEEIASISVGLAQPKALEQRSRSLLDDLGDIPDEMLPEMLFDLGELLNSNASEQSSSMYCS